MKYVLPRNTPSGNTDPNLPYWDGDRNAGITGAIPPAAAFTETMLEIQNAITLSGQVPDHDNLYQLWGAIQGLIAQAITGGLTTIEVPPGSMSMFAATVQPLGWLFCRGQAVSRSVNSALFAAIGTAWGAGDGSTTFNVPDARGEFFRGFDAGRGVDPGRTFASFQADEFKSHVHSFQQYVLIPNGEVDNNAMPGPSLAAQNTAAAGGVETRPRNFAVNFIIKT